MRLLLGLLISVVALCGVVRADKLGPRAFTDEFARALTAAMPSTTVTVRDDLELKLSDATGLERTVHLANSYKDYSLDPARFNDIVRGLVAAMSQSRSGSTVGGVDRSRIVPVIKDRPWLVALQNSLKARGLEPLSDPFNDELVIVYAEDDPARMRYLMTGEDIGVGRQELKALAAENLKRILPKIEMRVIGDVSIISAGGDYEASLLLIDEIWSGGQIKVKGDIVVAIPARDVLLVTGSRSRTGLKVVREMAAEAVSKGPYELIDTLFVYRDGRFTKFGRN
jgi:uncharacterized protein YtpQ (UPF0354 family)